MITYEAFVYLWYDSNNKMYYLGYHKGSIDDGYAHSSTKMESFTTNNVPSGYRRRILATGSNDDMIALEEKLLRNRKERGKWSIYHNASISGAVYMWDDPEYQKMMSEMMSEKSKKLWTDPEYRKMMSEKAKKQWDDPEYRKMMEKFWADPEFRKMMSEMMSEKAKKQWTDPEYRKMMSEMMSEKSKKLWTDPEYQKMRSEKAKKQWDDPEYRKMQSEKMKKQWDDPEYQKKMSERVRESNKKRKGMKLKKSKNKQVSSLKDFFA